MEKVVTTKDDVIRAAQELRDVALNAVEYVGHANYADREREALQWVMEASHKLDQALDQWKVEA